MTIDRRQRQTRLIFGPEGASGAILCRLRLGWTMSSTRVSLRSSSVAAVTYDTDYGTMDVEFRHGEVYRFFLVPQAVFRDFIEAPSAGRFFAERVRSQFREVRLS